MPEPWLIATVVALGFVCGFINVMAGGASFISLPALIFLGLPPITANGTNRVALLVQNVVAVRKYHQHGMVDWQAGKVLTWPTLLGALIGARIAVSFDEKLMTLVIAICMAAMFVILLWNPARLQGQDQGDIEMRPSWKMQLSFFAVGIYGGLIQAGSGIFMLFLIMASGYELLRASALRLLLVLCFTPFALAIFVIEGHVDWVIGLSLALGNASGAFVGVRVAVDRGAGFARLVLLVVLLGSTCLLFWRALVG